MQTYDDIASKPVWIIGGYPTSTDKKKGRVLGGNEGHELDKLLDEADIDQELTARINVASTHPPSWKSLYSTQWFCTKNQAPVKGYVEYGPKYIHPGLFNEIQELLLAIKQHRPRLIIGLGELPLLALTGNTGITNWRGSMLSIFDSKVIPAIAPDRFIKMWEWRYYSLQDFIRARREMHSRHYDAPVENFIIRPTFEQARREMVRLLALLSVAPCDIGVDIETRGGHITCIAFARSATEAICIPFVTIPDDDHPDGHYWTEAEEGELVTFIRHILTHKNMRAAGQNFHYDMQYIIRHWGVWPREGFDTQQMWHVIYLGLPRNLSFICSLVLPHYVYWKDENHDEKVTAEDEDDYWGYNCKDAARTLELVPYLKELLDSHKQWGQYYQQRNANRPHLKAMLRGIRRNTGDTFKEMLMYTLELQMNTASWLDQFQEALTGGQQLTKSKNPSPWYRSPTQLAKILYEIYKIKPQRDRKTGRPTTDEKALEAIMLSEPILRPLLTKVIEFRSLGVLMSTFLQPPLDWDGRMYTSLSVGFTETLRDASSKNAFHKGGNMQNIPSGN